MFSTTRFSSVAVSLLVAFTACTPSVETGDTGAAPTLVPLEEMTQPGVVSDELEIDPDARAAQQRYLQCLLEAGYDLTSAASFNAYFPNASFPFRGEVVLPSDYEFNVAHLTCEVESGLLEEPRDPKILAAQGSSRMTNHARCMRELAWEEFPDPLLLPGGLERQPYGQIIGEVIWPDDPEFKGDADRFWEDYRHCAEQINIPLDLYLEP